MDRRVCVSLGNCSATQSGSYRRRPRDRDRFFQTGCTNELHWPQDVTTCLQPTQSSWSWDTSNSQQNWGWEAMESRLETRSWDTVKPGSKEGSDRSDTARERGGGGTQSEADDRSASQHGPRAISVEPAVQPTTLPI